MKLLANTTFRWGDWASFEARLVPLLLDAADAGAQVVLDESQSLVPVAGGSLKESGAKSTEWTGTKVLGKVRYDAPHAAFVEFGTGLRGMGTYPFALPETGVPITGNWVYDYKQQDWPGQIAQPYLRPALDNKRADILAAFRSALAAAV